MHGSMGARGNQESVGHAARHRAPLAYPTTLPDGGRGNTRLLYEKRGHTDARHLLISTWLGVKASAWILAPWVPGLIWAFEQSVVASRT